MKEEHKGWLTKWKSPSDLERQFSPNNWGYALMNYKQAYAASCPTLIEYDRLYGEGLSVEWVRMQVMALYGSSSNRDKGIADGIKIFSQSFAGQVERFKISELMLFFARYKAGKYDNSYSTFDARRIGNAFFKEFYPERNVELDAINRKALQEEIEKRRFIPPDGYSSLSWYQELKRRADTGDKEALKMLMPP